MSEGLKADPEQGQITEQTYYWDRFRGVSQGILETVWQTFGLIIAIRYFHADESIKQYLPAAGGIGLILSPLFLAFFSRQSARISTQIALNWLFIALFVGLAALAPGAMLFIACLFLAQFTHAQSLALMTHMYARNYPPRERGTRLSMSHLFAAFGAIVFGYVGGVILDISLETYIWILLMGVGAALAGAWFSMRIPSEPGHDLRTSNVWESLQIAWRDRLFRWMLIAWMLMGMGNLMLMPIRVEYLANPIYGVNLSNTEISMLLVSTVMIFRLLSTRLWGLLFDRTNLITTRILLNFCFILSIAVFFNSTSLIFLGVGAALLGVAFGGGGIMWALFVTRVAPPDRVTSYMSVHGFLTGVRGAMAPFIGYTLIATTHASFTAWVSLLLISLSTFIFLPMRKAISERQVG